MNSCKVYDKIIPVFEVVSSGTIEGDPLVFSETIPTDGSLLIAAIHVDPSLGVFAPYEGNQYSYIIYTGTTIPVNIPFTPPGEGPEPKQIPIGWQILFNS